MDSPNCSVSLLISLALASLVQLVAGTPTCWNVLSGYWDWPILPGLLFLNTSPKCLSGLEIHAISEDVLTLTCGLSTHLTLPSLRIASTLADITWFALSEYPLISVKIPKWSRDPCDP